MATEAGKGVLRLIVRVGRSREKGGREGELWTAHSLVYLDDKPHVIKVNLCLREREREGGRERER